MLRLIMSCSGSNCYMHEQLDIVLTREFWRVDNLHAALLL